MKKFELNVVNFDNEDVIATSSVPATPLTPATPTTFKIDFDCFTAGADPLYPGGPTPTGETTMMKVVSGAKAGDKIVVPTGVTYTVIDATQGGEHFLWLSENGINRLGGFDSTQEFIFDSAEYTYNRFTKTYSAQ